MNVCIKFDGNPSKTIHSKPEMSTLRWHWMKRQRVKKVIRIHSLQTAMCNKSGGTSLTNHRPAWVAKNINVLLFCQSIQNILIMSKCQVNNFHGSSLEWELDIMCFCELPVWYQCAYYRSSSGSARPPVFEQSPSVTCSSPFPFRTSSSTALLWAPGSPTQYF